MSFNPSRSVADSCQRSYRGTISTNTSLASSMNISLISGSASLVSADKGSDSCTKGSNTSGISNVTKKSAVLLAVSSSDKDSSASSVVVIESLNAPSNDSSERLLLSDSDIVNPVLIGCCAMRLLLCTIVIAGSKRAGCCASKSDTSIDKRFVVSITKFTTSSVIGNAFVNRRLSKCSIDHAISLILKAPTTRPDPLSV